MSRVVDVVLVVLLVVLVVDEVVVLLVVELVDEVVVDDVVELVEEVVDDVDDVEEVVVDCFVGESSSHSAPTDDSAQRVEIVVGRHAGVSARASTRTSRARAVSSCRAVDS